MQELERLCESPSIIKGLHDWIIILKNIYQHDWSL